MAVGPKTPSLYSRMQTHGTLTEAPRDVPDARFALPSSIHWMRALAILAADQNVDFAAGRTFYAKVHARTVPDRELNTVCEQLLFVLNQIAALQALTSAPNKADVARTAIVAWYYGVNAPVPACPGLRYSRLRRSNIAHHRRSWPAIHPNK
jgi:hypothetical protein